MPDYKRSHLSNFSFLGFFSAFFIFLLCSSRVLASFYSTTIVPSSYINLGSPRDLITLPDGNMWYADSQNYRIVKISPTGEILRTVGRSGSGEGEFLQAPISITRDADGFLYVIDYQKIYKFDFNGGFIKSWGVFGNGVGELANPEAIHYSAHGDMLIVANSVNNRITKFDTDGNFISEFGSAGTGNGEFNEPHSLTTDTNGNIYVVDTNNHRVQIFQENGTFIRTFGNNDPGNYQLIFPKDVEVLSNGDIIVTSQNAPLIKKFTSAGVYISEWGTGGTGESQFINPEFLTKAADESIWVSDWSQRRLQHFTDDGDFIETIGNSWQIDGSFVNPYAIDFDSAGNIYALDSTGRVQKFNSDGTYISTLINSGTIGDDGIYHIAVSPVTGDIFVSSTHAVSVFDANGTFINTVGNHGLWEDPPNDGTGTGEFNNARGMAFDSSGILYVVDYSNARIQRFDITQIENGVGGYLDQWPVMTNPENIFIDGSDNVYVSPTEYNDTSLDIQKFSSTGVLDSIYLDKFGELDDQYYQIGGIYIDSSGNLYLSDRYYDRIQVYDSSGVWVETIGGPGSDQDQFSSVNYAKINPIDGSLVAVDTNNHRLQIFRDGVKIKNLITSADVINISNSLSLVRRTVDPLAPEVDNLDAELYFGNYIVSDFVVNLSSDRDWMNVNAIILPNESKSLVVNLNPSDAPGISETHSLFVVKQPGQTTVRVCPDAVEISDVSLSCTNGYVLEIGDPQLSSVTIGDIDYWKITGLTGTGALSETPDSTPTPTPTATPTPTLTSTSTNGLTSNSSSGGFSTNCSSLPVVGIPDLFQIDINNDTAKLFFTPLSETNEYYVSFSTNSSAEEHGELVSLMREGVQTHRVFYLKPNTSYYFKVRGQSGCSAGEWSNIMKVTTRSKNLTRWTSFYKNIPVKTSSLVKKSPILKKKVATQETVFGKPTDEAPSINKKVEVSNPPSPSPIPSSNKKWCFLKWCF